MGAEMNELGIITLREIIKTIRELNDYDFSNYAMTSFKYRLEKLIMKYNISNPENLIKKLQDEPEFFDLFLYEMSTPSTEMFRDPSLWRWLRENFLEEAISKNIGTFKIWLPLCVSGGELYSLAILLEEMKLLDQVDIFVTCQSETAIDLIKKGQYDLKKLEVSQENYRRFNGIEQLSDYYTINRYSASLKVDLIEKVSFTKTNIMLDVSPQNVKLILFRNYMIYYNSNLQEKVLKQLHHSLSANGHLIIGIRERINPNGTLRGFDLINETESVYKKKVLA